MWSAVLPVKRLTGAKTRLRGAVPEVAHPRLALAIALDTVAAVLACPLVDRVFVVTDDALVRAEVTGLGAEVVPDRPYRGLNAAF
ncbi:MAG: 2-phospho-L-lactate guanylyltransferase, partial [Actinocatenispora sp.]